MVVALGPGKFYGSSLPRPRFYTDVKLNSERVDPPVPVMDPLMQWANEAHWSMGGLNFKRLRLQGRIEGNVDRLRVQREKTFKKSERRRPKSAKRVPPSISEEDREESSEVSETPSPPPAPVAIKRRRVVGVLDEDADEAVEHKRRGPVRKLGDDFDKVAVESGMAVDDDGIGRSVTSEEPKRRGKLVRGGLRVGAAVVAAAVAARKSPRLSRKRLY
ncbi:uncharacterized protein LOC127247156 [Andrographis paniculata]|uniref:uncharacterized protein LOC127247156 n=1 Tax=Andrographis paniculata TaxID=175694 RepID=UPI0021E98081|nr:uncharacterized protein LOC127247156 [Andrographis paniculata]